MTSPVFSVSLMLVCEFDKRVGGCLVEMVVACL